MFTLFFTFIVKYLTNDTKTELFFLNFKVLKVNNGGFVLSCGCYSEISIKRKETYFLSHE